jgi:hypothetical protein
LRAKSYCKAPKSIQFVALSFEMGALTFLFEVKCLGIDAFSSQLGPFSSELEAKST